MPAGESLQGQRAGLSRAWGDGGGDERPHVILEIDLYRGQILCRCGKEVYDSDFMSLDRAWSDHRGLVYVMPKYGAQATDSEVHEFLLHVEDPTYTASMAGSHAVTRGVPDLTEAFDLLDRLLEERAS